MIKGPVTQSWCHAITFMQQTVLLTAVRGPDGIAKYHPCNAAEIVGYKHPDPDIRAWWHKTYLRLVHDMHLWLETEEQMDLRLGDDRSQWLARNDEATIA